MMKELQFPLNGELLIKKKRQIKKRLLDTDIAFLEIKIAILGGSTTVAIREMMELFLLDQGIQPTFYESEYAQYWQDAMFGALDDFAPDVVYIHTTSRNITQFPRMQTPISEIDEMLTAQYTHFESMWDTLARKYNCPVIQNNFERPQYRLLGNKDIVDVHGRTSFTNRLNQMLYQYAQTHSTFYINDIDYLSADYGLSKWHDVFYWNMYKYALCVPAIPALAFSVSNIIKSIYGKNKKAFVLDLDNTLWGGVIGDDGVENISIGPEVSMGEVYSEFQAYVKAHQDIGITLNVCSKNDEENALAGLRHPRSLLPPEEFICIRANWENKDRNVVSIAQELNIGTDSLVFVDDNPVERAIVNQQVSGVAVPEIGSVEQYIHVIDGSGFFEATTFSKDDLERTQMYRQNAQRVKAEQAYGSYEDFLLSLDMHAVIDDFNPVFLQRIVQLTNKSNQFNVTTKRYTEGEMQNVVNSDAHIRLYGSLVDKYGDNGVVSVVIGHREDAALHIDLWLMSCRVLKRDMEFAMLDTLVEEAKKANIQTIYGYYYPTAKNSMVRDLFGRFGFEKVQEDDAGNTTWTLDTSTYEKKCKVIQIKKDTTRK